MRVFLLKAMTELVEGYAFGMDGQDRVLLLMVERLDDEHSWTRVELLDELGCAVVELNEAEADAQVPVEIWQKLDEILDRIAEESMNLSEAAKISTRIARLSGSTPTVKVHG